ncbi:E3 ubiquitin/ISG15 ligase TRIM25-like isoform X2 [Amia ocellicauda]
MKRIAPYPCPHCRKQFFSFPLLSSNTMLCSMIDHVMKSKGDTSSSMVAEEDDVPCDICTGKKLKATQSCMNCLASFCDVHLQPHLQSTALKQHWLRSPVCNMQEMLCRTHGKLLEFFCKKHWTPICSLCLVKHRKCPTPTVKEIREAKEVEYKKKLKAIEEGKENIQEAICVLEDTEEETRVAADKIKMDLSKHFEALKDTINNALQKATRLIEMEEVAALNQVSKIQEQLRSDIQALDDVEEEIEVQLYEDDPFKFLQNQVLVPPLYETGQIPKHDIKLNGRAFEKIAADLTALHTSLTAQLQTVLQQKEEQETDGSPEDFCFVGKLRKPRRKLLKYACGVTFDPSTASASVLLSEDSRMATVEHSGLLTWKDYVIDMEMGFRVLCSQSFSRGQHYWEVTPPTGNSNWAVGVTYKSNTDCYRTLGKDNKSWCVKWHRLRKEEDEEAIAVLQSPSQGLFTSHDGEMYHVSQQCPEKVGVFLDCDLGIVSFFSISDSRATLWYKYEAVFSEPVYPAVWLREPENKMTIG